MLQQTQVATVIPYYERFLERFPTLESLAAGPIEDVLARWSGLGYYSRARNLFAGAKVLTERGFPRDREALLKVPGIGPYTAGAILSIAFDRPEPIVDGNVVRVFSRVYALRHLEPKPYWEKAREWVEAGESPRVLNQALMELGATVCVKGTPRCHACPLQSGCAAYRLGIQSELPVPKPRKEKVEVAWNALVLVSGNRIFLRRNRPGEWWADLWDFPQGEPPTGAQALGRKTHTVTHHHVTVTPYLVRTTRATEAGEWFTLDEAARLPVSSLARKVMSECRDVLECGHAQGTFADVAGDGSSDPGGWQPGTGPARRDPAGEPRRGR